MGWPGRSLFQLRTAKSRKMSIERKLLVHGVVDAVGVSRAFGRDPGLEDRAPRAFLLLGEEGPDVRGVHVIGGSVLQERVAARLEIVRESHVDLVRRGRRNVLPLRPDRRGLHEPALREDRLVVDSDPGVGRHPDLVVSKLEDVKELVSEVALDLVDVGRARAGEEDEPARPVADSEAPEPLARWH